MSAIHPLSDLRQPGPPAGSGATPDVYNQTRRRTRTIKGDWSGFFTELTNKLEEEERQFDWVKYREGVRNQAFYSGNFFIRVSEQTGMIRDLPHTDEDPFFPHNWFQYFVDLSVSAALEASPAIMVDAASDDDHNIAAAKAGQRCANYNETELLTEEFRLESEKLRQLYCGVWWHSYWNMDSDKLFASRPVFEERTEKHGGDSFICGSPNCENMGPIERLMQTVTGATCPKCGRSDQLQIIQAPEVTVHEITKYEKVPIGFPVLEAVTPLQMKGDRRAGHYLRGNYLCRSRLVDRDTVAEMIPWWDAERGGAYSAGSEDYGIRAEEMVRRPNGSNGSTAMPVGASDREKSDVVVKQWWLRPCKYAHIEFEEDVEFIGEKNTKVPAHTPLGEIFPKGLYLLKVGKDWLDHAEKDFRKEWVYIPYVYEPHKADGGSTITAMVEPQREMIEVNSLLFLYLKARSGGAPTIIQSPLSETDFDGSPATITRLPQGSPDISKLFFQPEFPPADSNLAAYANRMSGEMQIMAQVVSPTTSGDPSAQEMGGTETARGMMIMNAKAQGLQGPKLMPLAYGQAQAVLQWIDLWRENVVDDVPIPLRGKTGEPEWFMLNGSDLEGDFAVYPKPKSWLPHPREEQQAALQNAFTVFGQILLNPQAPASLKEKILEVYGIDDVDLDNYDQDMRDAMLRIDAMEAMVPQAMKLAQWYLMQMANQPLMAAPPPPTSPGPMQQPGPPPVQQPPQSPQADMQEAPPDPAEIAGGLLAKMVPIDEDLDEPGPYMDYYRNWLKGDEGKDADPILRAGVKAQWKMYSELQRQRQQAAMQAQADALKMQEMAKAEAQLTVEQAKGRNKMAEISAKGQSDAATAAATPPEMAAPMAPPPPDNTVRDKIVEAAIGAAQEDQKHGHRIAELGMTHAHRTREAMAKGMMAGMPAGGGLSQAGVGGSLVSGARQVPKLSGAQYGVPDLPPQPAI